MVNSSFESTDLKDRFGVCERTKEQQRLCQSIEIESGIRIENVIQPQLVYAVANTQKTMNCLMINSIT